MAREVSQGAPDPSALRIVLASQSPRRRDLLSLIGIPHSVRPANIDEAVLPGEHALACVERLARTKAMAIAALDPDAIIIGADTVVVIDDRVLNKPADAAEARAMLGTLQGRNHLVYTAVCVSGYGRVAAGVEPVQVRIRLLTDTEIDAYIATGEPMDKAGAYGIQGYGATIVEWIEGDFFAVMGLPLVRLIRLLREIGVDYQFGRLRAGA
jgi:septum formation protein